MKSLHERFPHYNWAKNKGYATKDHQKALNEHGPCCFHRKSFRLDYTQPALFTDAASSSEAALSL
jgi:ribonuclease HII